MKTSSAKAKGRRLQQLVRDFILNLFTELTPDDVRSTGMGQSGVDIQLSSLAKKVFPYSVECKNKERISLWQELKQAEQNKDPGTEPLLIIKRNRTEPYAVLTFKHFMELLSEAKDKKNS